jgi:hypothetical protein
MFVIPEWLYGTQGRREKKENDRASTISKHVTSVKEDLKGYVLKAAGEWRVEEE